MNIRIFKHNFVWFLGGILFLGVFVVWSLLKAAPTCPSDHNICRGTMNVGGQQITYYYTRYMTPGGNFKIRFNAGNVNTSNYILFSASKFPVTPTGNTQSRTCGNPPPFLYTAGNRVTLACTEVTVSNFVATSEGLTQGDLDFVMNIPLPDITTGNYTVDLFMQFGSAPVIEEIPFEVSDVGSLNTNENMSFTIGNTTVQSTCSDYSVGDPLWGDNDLDYYADCRDSDCDDIVGNPDEADFCRFADETSRAGEEGNCYDRFDNDFDADGNTGWDYNRETGLDCRDLDCDGQLGDAALGPAGESLDCWFNDSVGQGAGEAKGYPESCRDNFNNDSDNGEGAFVGSASYNTANYLDCLDRNCWRLGGSAIDIFDNPCPAREDNDPSWCLDALDNDFDDGINSLDKSNASGRDCADYDCALTEYAGGSYFDASSGNTYACPFNEARGPDGAIDAARCFDGADNDLDACQWDGEKYVKTGTDEECNPGPGYLIDCADQDCLGVENPNNPGQICFPNEFEVGNYQVCSDDIDNDGDDPNPAPPNRTVPTGAVGGRSCEDNLFADGSAGDCWRQFGNCGPCPVIENLTYDACADGNDNDLDGTLDCADADNDCVGELGRLAGAALCVAAGGESSALCFDGFDNDAAGGADCADNVCLGASRTNPLGLQEICATEDTAEFCVDTFDNNANGDIDCLDSSCAGVGQCAASWLTSSCVTVPEWSSWTNIVPSLRARQYARARVLSEHWIEIEGSASSYSTLNIIIGSNVEGQSADQYPYDLTACVFELPSGSNLEFQPDSPKAGSIVPAGAGSIGPFTARLRCPTPGTPSVSESFQIQISANGSAGLEIAEANFGTSLYEDTPPQVTEIEAGGVNDAGLAHVPYGNSITLRGVPSDPDAGIGSTGICSCQLTNFSTEAPPPSYETSSGSDCRFTISDIRNDDFYELTVKAIDGADNISNTGSSDIFMIDVIPIAENPPILDRKDSGGNDYPAEFSPFISPFYKADDKIVFSGAQFRAADNGSFPDSACVVEISDDESVVYSGNASKSGSGNVTSCQGVLDVEDLALAADGRYYLSLSVTDDGGYQISSPRQVFYVCGFDPAQYPEGHPCQLADFDQDGAVEGVRARGQLYGGGSCSDDPAASCFTDADCAEGVCLSDLVCDNCLNLKNSDQRDFNANGIGDVCEPTGFCVLDSQPCSFDSDCAANLCQGGFCSIDGAACASDSDCLPNYCGTSPGECLDNSDICLMDGQCDNGEQCNNQEGGYCEGDPGQICFFDSDCDERCVEGSCEIQGIACQSDADCTPICDDINPDPDIDEYRCSNDISIICDPAEDPLSQCRKVCESDAGVCDNDPDQPCLDDGDCPGGSCGNPRLCENDGSLCLDDSDCDLGISCGEGSLERCSLSGAPCRADADCGIGEYCGASIGVCSLDGLACSLFGDCQANVCGAVEPNRCSLDGFPCSSTADCVQQVCEKNIGRCREDLSGDKLCLNDSDCTDGCVKDFGLCAEQKEFCALDGQCASNDCQSDFGLCSDSGTVCANDIHCSAGEQCEDIGYPWLQTKYGSIYTKGEIRGANQPPAGIGKYTASYCIFAGQDIDQFTIKSGASCSDENIPNPFNYPGIVSRFASVIGRLDLAGLLAGQYGQLQEISSWEEIPDILAGKVYKYNLSGSLSVGGKQLLNGIGSQQGNGLVLVYGDILIGSNVSYSGGDVNNLNQLASLGWLALDDPATPEKEGNIFISPSVTKLVGAFYAENIIDTGQSFRPLTINGLLLGKEFKFKRLFSSMNRGSEQIIYDSRLRVNPPPGLADLTKALPILQPF